MKKGFLLFIFFAVSAYLVMAQVPQAFKYQAVVRDANGLYIADRDVSLKINIIAGSPDGMVIYSEMHSVHSNALGLVNLEIGRGSSPSADFSKINWASGSYYVSIELDEHGGQNFSPIGVSQLLAVPYALHSETASALADKAGMEMSNDPGVPAHAWSLFGNSSSASPDDKLGTTDAADLMMVTNNIERMRIFADGNIDVARSMTIGENLVVKHNVDLNTIGGETDNHGPFTVSELSPTLLSGTLTVDGSTDLNSTLNVDGITDLNSNLNVNNHKPTKLTGTLWVQHDATFDSLVKINAKRDSYTKSMGALVVAGGLGIGNNLTVGDTANFEGPLMVKNENESTATDNGALVVAGGVGIGKRLNVGGRVEITAPLGASKDTIENYPLIVKGASQGIAVKVEGASDNSHNYLVFMTSDGVVHGRIEGQSLENLENDEGYKLEKDFKQTAVDLSITDMSIGSFELLQAVINVTCANTSTTVCAGLGACITGPIPSLIVSAGANLALKIANTVKQAISYTQTVDDRDNFIESMHDNLGVSYQSGAADYAEYLLKENPAETFNPGDLVGIRNGIVTKNLFSADQIMVVSTNPIVLGNIPPQGQERNYVKIAFMGQVPVTVLGAVKPGDYILPSEINNSFGKAVNPADMKLDDYKRIAGVAWSDITHLNSNMSQVNVAVGINANDLTNVLYQHEEKFNNLKKEYDQFKLQSEKSNAALAKLLPGYAEAIGYESINDNESMPVSQTKAGVIIGGSDVKMQSPDDIIHFEFSRQEIESSLDLARENYVQSLAANADLMKLMADSSEYAKDAAGNILIPIKDDPFWKRIDNEPGYREAIVNMVKDYLEKSLYTQRKYLGNFTNVKIKE